MAKDPVAEKLQRIVYREFLLEPTLLEEVGLEDLPARLAALLGCQADEAVALAVRSPLLKALTVEQLRGLTAIRDMAFVSRTAAALSAELKEQGASYNRCCRTALCYAVIGSHGHSFSALRAAAAKNDGWARHHYLYGLTLGQQENLDRARWELGMALESEPYEEGRLRIRFAMDVLDGTV